MEMKSEYCSSKIFKTYIFYKKNVFLPGMAWCRNQSSGSFRRLRFSNLKIIFLAALLLQQILKIGCGNLLQAQGIGIQHFFRFFRFSSVSAELKIMSLRESSLYTFWQFQIENVTIITILTKLASHWIQFISIKEQ